MDIKQLIGEATDYDKKVSIFANGEKLDISIALGKQKEQAECLSAQEVMNASKRGVPQEPLL